MFGLDQVCLKLGAAAQYRHYTNWIGVKMVFSEWLRTKIKKFLDNGAEILVEKQLQMERKKRKLHISDTALAFYQTLNTSTPGVMPKHMQFEIKAYLPPANVAPAVHVKSSQMAMDAGIANFQGPGGGFFSQLGFPGFPYLTELSQITEYRDMSERVSAEMTRKWIKFRSISNEKGKTDKIKQIEASLKKHRIRDLFRQAAVYDGFFGRSQIFINLGATEGAELTVPLILDPAKIKEGSLKGFKLIEPSTTYPAQYNASKPMQFDYYCPSSWYVYGQEVHASRLLTFVSRPLPDLLKPVYNFSGISLSQLAQPYVDYWLSTRDSVGKLLKNFSTTTFTTDLTDFISDGDGAEVFKRIKLFTSMRDNQGVFVLDSGRGDDGEKLAGQVHFEVIVPFEGDAEVTGDTGAAVFGGEDEGGFVLFVLFHLEVGFGFAFELGAEVTSGLLGAWVEVDDAVYVAVVLDGQAVGTGYEIVGFGGVVHVGYEVAVAVYEDG